MRAERILVMFGAVLLAAYSTARANLPRSLPLSRRALQRDHPLRLL